LPARVSPDRMVSMLGLADQSDERVVDALGSAPRTSSAYRHLLNRGRDAVPAIRVGLRHPDPVVREPCRKLLDHLLVEDAVEEMIAMLDDPVPAVRTAAVHALACDRCKTDACRPAEALVLPPGLRLLCDDPDAHVRAMAVELVGRFVHSSAEGEAALVRVRESDPSPAVRKKRAGTRRAAPSTAAPRGLLLDSPNGVAEPDLDGCGEAHGRPPGRSQPTEAVPKLIDIPDRTIMNWCPNSATNGAPFSVAQPQVTRACHAIALRTYNCCRCPVVSLT